MEGPSGGYDVRVRAVVATFLVSIACGGRAPRTAPPQVTDNEAEPVGAAVPAGADPACVGACRKRFPAAADPGFVGYCDELCSPVTEPSTQCQTSCERSHEPGARYDDNGDYVQLEDERDAAQRAADSTACREECSTIPTLSDEALAACVGACTTSGGNEASCSASCDPDPYDECRYSPCD